MSLVALISLTWAALPPAGEVARADTKPTAAAVTPAGLGAIEPFIKTHCIECHGGKSKKADLDLTTFKDEQSILKGRKVWQAALEQVHGGDMPPDKRPQPTEAEKTRFLSAVGAIFEKADRTAKPDPGRVTVRRLNRAEYDNTIRDLLGVDWAPAADFPSDDVGHGFDNIGDVLSVSPVLMERYLAAAETIMAKAIALEPIKPNSRHTGAQFTEPAGRIPEVRYRPVFAGSIFTKFKLNDEGEYKLRTRALVGAPDAKWTAARPDDAKAAKGKDGEPIKAALLIDGKEVQAFDVTATDGRKAPTIEHTVTL
ncbi:MAG TPA: DUF1587 domain-containing protein, partial [Tepidisphaeraceae bacterium]|nr:DUF1587 domain-containing protein [Tepidisphaeraceae bacterium]